MAAALCDTREVTAYVALLRGINLGARNKVPMKELRALFEDLGHEDVKTYLQSGNVIFKAGPGAATAGEGIERALVDTFGFDVSVMLRTRKEMAAIAAANPFPTEGVAPTSLHVLFLARRPAAAAVRALDPDRSPPDEFAVKGREIYLSYPNGAGRSKLSLDYFEKKLAIRGTARNWNTVTKVLDLMNSCRSPGRGGNFRGPPRRL